ncbi:MAG TPA: hypothetical protein VGN04_01290 [Herbaspirillum sp.]|jgi:hypothetical protein
MSIAISVESNPSRGRLLLMAIAPIASIAVGAIAFLQFVGEFNAIAGTIAGGMALALSVYGMRSLQAGAGGAKIRLAIAGNGELTLVRCREKHPPAADRSEIVQLMPGSTLWPFFILLRLRQQNKNMIVVPFFWGSLSPQHFRRLSVACRWIAARNDVLQSADQVDFQ